MALQKLQEGPLPEAKEGLRYALATVVRGYPLEAKAQATAQTHMRVFARNANVVRDFERLAARVIGLRYDWGEKADALLADWTQADDLSPGSSTPSCESDGRPVR